MGQHAAVARRVSRLLCADRPQRARRTRACDPDGARPPVWFAFDESRPLAFFAGLWTHWTSVRKVNEGRDDQRPLRLLDLRSQRRSQGNPSEGDARHSHHARRGRRLDDGAGERSSRLAAAVARRKPSGCGARRSHRRCGWRRTLASRGGLATAVPRQNHKAEWIASIFFSRATCTISALSHL